MKKEIGLGLLCILSSITFVILFISLVSAGELRVTQEHPFLVDGEWIDASGLKVGDLLTTPSGEKVRITSLEDVVSGDNFLVYNLEAFPYSDFVVSSDNLSVVVHNSKCIASVGCGVAGLAIGGEIVSGGNVCIGEQTKNSCSLDEEEEDADTVSTDYKEPLLSDEDLSSIERLNNNQKYHEIEDAVYSNLAYYKPQIMIISNKLGIDPRTLVSLIYVEKVQYELNEFLWLINPRKVKMTLLGFVGDNALLYKSIQEWADFSAGYCHIKPEHAQETKSRLDLIPGFNNYITDYDVENFHNEIISSLKIAASSLRIFQDEWKNSPQGTDISNRPDILSTCFNFGYDKVIPKTNPTPDIKGTTDLPVIVDGVFYEEMNFGRKVEIVYNSKKMQKFFLNGFN